MKRIIFLLVGVLLLSLACQDEFNDPVANNSATKSAKYDKTKTYQVKGWVTAIGNSDAPSITCVPVEAGVVLSGSGWVDGHENILGKFDVKNSTYEKDYCEFSMTNEGPLVYTRTNVILQNMSGEQLFVVNHMWLNVATSEISGYSEIIDGTDRFEGASGSAVMLNGKVDQDSDVASWEEEGEITLVIKES